MEPKQGIVKRLLASYLLVTALNFITLITFGHEAFHSTSGLLLIGSFLLIINVSSSIYFALSAGKKLNNLRKEIHALHSQKVRQSNESAIQVMQAQEEEREKISFTLHDSVGQYLTVLKWGLSELKVRAPHEKDHINNLAKTCDDIIHEIRSISHDLMPTLIRDFGVCMAIKDYFEKQKQIVPLSIEFTHSEDLTKARFNREFNVNLYRMVQELFQNTLKHSGARTIKLDLKFKNNKLELNYHDDGKGMASQSPLPTSLNYRAKLFGGEMMRVHYDKGLGFKVIFNLEDIGHETN